MSENTINKLFKRLTFSKKDEKKIEDIILSLDSGSIRVAEKIGENWVTNEWIKKAILLYFKIRKMETIEIDPFEFHDKIPLKKGFKNKHIRVVPHAIIRHGSFVNKNVIVNMFTSSKTVVTLLVKYVILLIKSSLKLTLHI